MLLFVGSVAFGPTVVECAPKQNKVVPPQVLKKPPTLVECAPKQKKLVVPPPLDHADCDLEQMRAALGKLDICQSHSVRH